MGIVLVASVLLGGCRTEGPSRVDVAESIGNAVAERLAQPIEAAIIAAPANSHDSLNEALDEILADLPVPEGVSHVLPGNTSWTVIEDWRSFSMALVVVPDDDESRFCMVLAVTNDGQVVTGLDQGHPRNRCEETELIDLALTR
jgi:hypothetical protein